MAAANDTADREIVTVRDIAAPRELVFRAWTDPAHVSNWWGPNGFTTTTEVMDVRPGGTWRFVMHGPDGTDYPNVITYLAVERPAKLVYQHEGEAAEHVEFHTTVTFDDAGGKTRVTLRAVFPTAAARDRAAREYGAVEGGRQTLDRFAARVAELAGAGGEIVNARVFDAPRERLFRAFTDPEQLKHWWGPDGFTNTIQAFDPRPGGVWKLVMHGPDGSDYHNESVFAEVAEPSRVVFDHIEPVHRFRMSMTFDDESGRTRLTWRMRFEDAAEAQRVRGFVAAANEQNFDRLARHLATA
ncbi:SRPBCC family protein [Gemmata sp. JC717]|nr:SRPBCC family protein [Gemmata algarum]MDY3552550.1 SRPBCC family protein [Gemmata algarum]